MAFLYRPIYTSNVLLIERNNRLSFWWARKHEKFQLITVRKFKLKSLSVLFRVGHELIWIWSGTIRILYMSPNNLLSRAIFIHKEPYGKHLGWRLFHITAGTGKQRKQVSVFRLVSLIYSKQLMHALYKKNMYKVRVTLTQIYGNSVNLYRKSCKLNWTGKDNLWLLLT